LLQKDKNQVISEINNRHERVQDELEQAVRCLVIQRDELEQHRAQLEEQVKALRKLVQEVRDERDDAYEAHEQDTRSLHKEIHAGRLREAELRAAAEGVQAVVEQAAAAAMSGSRQSLSRTEGPVLVPQPRPPTFPGDPGPAPRTEGPPLGWRNRRAKEENYHEANSTNHKALSTALHSPSEAHSNEDGRAAVDRAKRLLSRLETETPEENAAQRKAERDLAMDNKVRAIVAGAKPKSASAVDSEDAALSALVGSKVRRPEGTAQPWDDDAVQKVIAENKARTAKLNSLQA